MSVRIRHRCECKYWRLEAELEAIAESEGGRPSVGFGENRANDIFISFGSAGKAKDHNNIVVATRN